jgi:hypothetical protein
MSLESLLVINAINFPFEEKSAPVGGIHLGLYR